MKSTLITIILLLHCLFLNAQIYNAGFENWTNMGSYEVPDQWGTMNHATSHLNIYTVTKWNPGSPGAYFMKITSKMYGVNVMNGIAVYGKLDSTTMLPVSGYPFTQRPSAFTGQWQHMIWGTSQGSVCAVLTKWNIGANKRDTIAIAYEELFDMAMSWEPFSVSFNYLSTDNPDSCMIVLKSSGDDPELNDYLWVDDLGFSGMTGIDDESMDNEMKIYPNPVSDYLIIDDVSGKMNFELFDNTGRIVFSKEAQFNETKGHFKIDLSEIAPGYYILKTNGFTRKIIIN